MSVHIKRIVRALLTVIVSSVIITHLAFAEPSAGISAFMRQVPASDVGIVVADAKTGRIEYSSAPDKELLPASTQKIITSSAALDLLGSEFRFTTRLYYMPEASNPTLMVRGGGDPTLTTEKVYDIVRRLKAQGVSAVRTLAIDTSAFIDKRAPTGARAYNAAPHATSINYNAQERVVCKRPPFDCVTSYESLERPDEAFAGVWKTVLQETGFPSVKVVFRPVDTGAKLVYEHRSEPLPKIIFDLNHFSTNVIADSLVYALGEEATKKQGMPLQSYSFRRGLERIQRWLVTHGIDGIRLDDGSGLSVENRVTPRALYRTLTTALERPHVGPELLASFSIAHESGTLKSRQFNPNILFRGKSGLLNGVVALAGILRTMEDRDKIVIIMLNGVRDPEQAKRWEEQLINYVYEQKS
jgi:D-alanyl-D-alanine carboxypeptidase/D-alanyl-D-alanine-endopeptidase (penicillin-binding protein 4)